MPQRPSRNSALSPNAARMGGAPELAGWRDPSGRWKWIRSDRNRIPLACCQIGSPRGFGAGMQQRDAVAVPCQPRDPVTDFAPVEGGI